MSIFCIGQSAYDITIPLKEPLIKNRKYRIEKCHECGGGPAFNAACLCAMWGARYSWYPELEQIITVRS